MTDQGSSLPAIASAAGSLVLYFDKGVLKKLEEANLRQSYEAAVELLDRIPPEIIRAYSGRSVHRRGAQNHGKEI